MSGLSRRNFLMGSAVGGLAPMLGRGSQAQRSRPNVLLIIAGDVAAWMCGCYGNQEIRTPSIDQLARLGVRFRNAFCTTPASSASRATLFTGRTPMQHGIHDFLTAEPVASPAQGQQAPPPSFASEVMLSDLLAKAGYHCGYAGRWAMGGDENPGRGYSFTYTMKAGPLTYRDPVMYRNGKEVKETGYLTDLITAAAVEFLDRQQAGEPFCLVIGYPNAHPPYDGHPQKYYDMYAETEFDSLGWQRPAANALRGKEMLSDIVGNIRKAAASVSALDAQIPILLGRLRDQKLWTDTLIVFTSDSGHLLGRHGLWGSGLASDPINMFDETMQVPLIMSWPGEIPVEAQRPEQIGFYDIFPTLCELTGVATPEGRNLPGRSFVHAMKRRPLARDEAAWPSTVYGYYRNTRMARERRFKLIVRNDGAGPNEFYTLDRDAQEFQNRYDDRRVVTVRDRMRRQVDEWVDKYSS